MNDKISIIIPYKNLQNLTQTALDTILLYTRKFLLTIILVDDGSNIPDKVVLHEQENERVTYISLRNEMSAGWCEAVNKGLASISSDTDYVVVMNNDISVTPDWLESMLQHLNNDASIGVIGPTANRVRGKQNIDDNRPGVSIEYVDSLFGFCLMLKKGLVYQIIQKDGFFFDPRFGLGGMDDADLCLRIKDMGYKVAIARDSFIYHYGSASFREEFANDIPKSKEYAESRIDILKDKLKPELDPGKRMIMIAMPTLGTVRTEIIPRLVHWAKNERYNVVIPTETPVLQPLDNARNYWVKKFLEISNHPDDRLWFIDDDIIPPFDALENLAGHDKDAVGATCLVMKADKGQYFPYPVALRYNENKEFIVFYGQGLEQINGTGGGCLLVKRKVYETMDRPYEYKYYPDGTLELVADFHFCQKLEKNGFTLWIDFDCIADHIKAISLKGINDLMLSLQQPRTP